MSRWIQQCLNTGLTLNEKYPNTRQYGARHALLVLSAVNLLNFADRYVPSAVKQLIIDDLNITDFQSSLPATVMIVVYMFFSIFFGYISDRNLYDRRVILWLAIMFWSVATGVAGFSNNLTQLILFRSAVGVGEAAYGTIAPTMLGDFYPKNERNVAYGVYYLAIPIGGALGYGIGAVIGQIYGWRIAFYVCGIPGIIVALSILKLNDPVRGINDDFHVSNSDSTKLKQTFKEEFSKFLNELIQILKNKHYMLATAGLVASNFCLGGLAEWLATFLLRYDNVQLDTAGLVVGAATLVGGLVGTIIGSKLVEKYKNKIRNAEFFIPAMFCIPAAICLLLALNIENQFYLVVFLIFMSEIMVWIYIAPISSISISSIPPSLRARSCGFQIFMQHILGDIIASPIIGVISDSSGSLRLGLQLTWIALFINAIFWFAGYLLPPLTIRDETIITVEPSFRELLCKREVEELDEESALYIKYSSSPTGSEPLLRNDDHLRSSS